MRVAVFAAAALLIAAHLPVVSGQRPILEERLDPALVHVVAPVLRDWIVQSRDEALADGVEKIPPVVRSSLSGYVPEDILNRVRWRVGGGGQLSLQQNSFYFAETSAVTLDYVIVFREEADALDDVELWVHELKHVIQFMEWGIEEFATRYLLDYEAVESEASRYRWDWVFRDQARAERI